MKDVRSVELNDIVVKDLDTARMAVRLGDSNGVGAVVDDFGLSWVKRHFEAEMKSCFSGVGMEARAVQLRIGEESKRVRK